MPYTRVAHLAHIIRRWWSSQSGHGHDSGRARQVVEVSTVQLLTVSDRHQHRRLGRDHDVSEVARRARVEVINSLGNSLDERLRKLWLVFVLHDAGDEGVHVRDAKLTEGVGRTVGVGRAVRLTRSALRQVSFK